MGGGHTKIGIPKHSLSSALLNDKKYHDTFSQVS